MPVVRAQTSFPARVVSKGGTEASSWPPSSMVISVHRRITASARDAAVSSHLPSCWRRLMDYYAVHFSLNHFILPAAHHALTEPAMWLPQTARIPELRWLLLLCGSSPGG